MFVYNVRAMVVLSVLVCACSLQGDEAVGTSLFVMSGADAGTAAFMQPRLQLPFPKGVAYRCTQGANGSTSHQGNTTRYDLDFDTPNNRDDVVVAPVSGVVHIHWSSTGFGNHVNIDVGGGYFVLVAHLKTITVEDGRFVQVGREVGKEGSTGNSSGDHIHFGVHRGDPARDAAESVSVRAERVWARNQTIGSVPVEIPSEQFVCELMTGQVYESDNGTLRHPWGTLVKRAGSSRVYLIDNAGRLRWLTTEDVLLSRRLYSDPGDPFGLVVTISDEEFACYELGSNIDWPVTMRVTRCSDGEYYLTLNDRGDVHKWWIPGNPGDDLFTTLVRSWGFRDIDVVEGHPSCSYPTQARSLYLRDGTLFHDPLESHFGYVAHDGLTYDIRFELAASMGYNIARILRIPWGTTEVMTRGHDVLNPDLAQGNLLSCQLVIYIPPADDGMPGAGGGLPPPPEPEPAPPDASSPPEDPPDAGTDARIDAVPDVGTDPVPPACVPAPELCNGVDDDCDGVADNGFTLQNDMQNCGFCGNRCNPANDECHNGACRPWPQSEAASGCNNRDDDYDGIVDGYVLPCSGACGAGQQTCTAGTLTACMPTAPPPEVCNAYDDDCDGSVDEGGVCPVVECDADHDGEPNTTCGGRDCDDANASISPRATERCNGRDDTCNGGVDEGFDFLNDPTHCGSCANTCAAGWVCLGGRCTEPCTPAGAETCNGRDDDCDGLVDEATVCSPPPSACSHRIQMAWAFSARWSLGADISGGGERFPDLYWWPAQVGAYDMVYTGVCPGWARANVAFPDTFPPWLVFRRPDGTVEAGPSLPRVTVDGAEAPLFPVADSSISGPGAALRFCVGGVCP